MNNYKFVHLNGNLELAPNFGKTHHFQLLDRILDDDPDAYYASDFAAGVYSEDPFEGTPRVELTWEPPKEMKSDDSPSTQALALRVKNELSKHGRYYAMVQRVKEGALTLIPGGGEGGLRFKQGDPVTGAPGSKREGMRGYIFQVLDGDDYDYLVQWYPVDSDLEWRNDDELAPYGYTGPQRLQASRLSATVEDTEPANNFGFLKEPHDDLYPAAFDGDTMKPEAIRKVKKHVLDAINKEYRNADEFIYFTVYGSGASYNWDEDGDFDVQMWVSYKKFLSSYNKNDVTEDDLLADIRRLTQGINFPSFAELGLKTDDCEGLMLIQYYPKPGEGSREENLASKPYACYDMETKQWLYKPKPITPEFYGEAFMMVYPKAEDIAIQAEGLLDELERNIIDYQFWTLMAEKDKNDEIQNRIDGAKKDAEGNREGVKNLFENVFQGRSQAYSPEGKGIEDERDVVQKLLEVWGVFQRLKHDARAPFPWEEEKSGYWIRSEWEDTEIPPALPSQVSDPKVHIRFVYDPATNTILTAKEQDASHLDLINRLPEDAGWDVLCGWVLTDGRLETVDRFPGWEAITQQAVEEFKRRGWPVTGYVESPKGMYPYEGKTAAQGTPANYTDDDPLDIAGKMPFFQKLQTDWANRPIEEAAQAVANALRATIISPQLELKWNAVAYQALMSVPATEDSPDAYEGYLRDWKRRFDNPGQLDLEGGEGLGSEEVLPGERMNPPFWGRVRTLAEITPYIEDLTNAALADVKSGGQGFTFREHAMQIPSVGPKVASFAWLILQPTTCELAALDSWMMFYLTGKKTSPPNDESYFTYEEQLRQERDERYPGVPLGQYQWGVWDKIRTEGYHQDHSPFRVIEPTPYTDVNWSGPTAVERAQLERRKPMPAAPGQMNLLGSWKTAGENSATKKSHIRFPGGDDAAWPQYRWVMDGDGEVFFGSDEEYDHADIQQKAEDEHGRELWQTEIASGYYYPRNEAAVVGWCEDDLDMNDIRKKVEEAWGHAHTPPEPAKQSSWKTAGENWSARNYGPPQWQGDERFSSPFAYIDNQMLVGYKGEFHSDLLDRHDIWVDSDNWDVMDARWNCDFGRFDSDGNLFLFGDNPTKEDFDWAREQLKLGPADSDVDEDDEYSSRHSKVEIVKVRGVL
jgi:hypothetical protein